MARRRMREATGTVHSRIAAFAGRQHGVFTRSQATELGATRAVIEWSLRSGRWERVHHGVYRVVGAPSTLRQAAMAACLATGGSASHATAARLHGLDELGVSLRLGTTIEVIVQRGRRRVVPGVVAHEAADLQKSHMTVVDAIPTTTIPRTLVDLAPSLERGPLERLLDELLRRRLVTLPSATHQLDQSKGRGLSTIRRLVRDRAEGRPTRDSDLEDIFQTLIDASGMPEAASQYRVRDRGRVLGRLDFAYPEVRVGVETHGGQHLTERQKRQDQERQNQIQSRDWILLSFYRSDLEGRPEHVCAELARTLTSRALALGKLVPRTRKTPAR